MTLFLCKHNKKYHIKLFINSFHLNHGQFEISSDGNEGSKINSSVSAMKIPFLPIHSTGNTAKPLKERHTVAHITIFWTHSIFCEAWLVKTDLRSFRTIWNALNFFLVRQHLAIVRAEEGVECSCWWLSYKDNVKTN